MEAGFWHKKWQTKEIGFHQAQANSLLVKHLKTLPLEQGARIFLPLCGKTLDIAWLLSNGYSVAGAELSRIAIEELFLELGIQPEVRECGKLTHYSGDNIDIFVGDIFDLSATVLGPVDAIYDRAALVALPEKMRQQYTRHLIQLTNKAPQLIICFEYDQSLVPGPPFSIDAKEVKQHYSDSYHLNCIESIDLAGGLKGKYPATESAWLLVST